VFFEAPWTRLWRQWCTMGWGDAAMKKRPYRHDSEGGGELHSCGPGRYSGEVRGVCADEALAFMDLKAIPLKLMLRCCG